MTFLQDGQYCINKHHWTYGLGWDEGALNNLGTAIRDWYNTDMKGNVNNECSLVSIECFALDGSGLATAVTTGLPIVGSSGLGGMSPNNVTVAVKKATGRAGRSYRGRTYVVGLPLGAYSDNRLTTTYATALLDAFDALTAVGGPLDIFQLVVLSEVSGGVPRAEGVTTPVTGFAIDPVLDSQRRRLPGRGR
jgi:hypothetical protein